MDAAYLFICLLTGKTASVLRRPDRNMAPEFARIEGDSVGGKMSTPFCLLELAEQPVKTRVEEGGHDIPKDVIKRRYYNSIENLFNLYHGLWDVVLIYDNSLNIPDLVYSYDNK
jgi:hypothetical protein